MLRSVPQCMGQSPPQRILWPQMSTTPRVRNCNLSLLSEALLSHPRAPKPGSVLTRSTHPHAMPVGLPKLSLQTSPRCLP